MAKGIYSYFTKAELILWISSVLLITVSFLIFDRTNHMTLVASLIGVTSLILGAKGNPLSQVLIIVFSIIYGIISYKYTYYGEMITYIGMTTPMAIYALVSWLKNPYKGNKSEVSVNRINIYEFIFLLILSSVVTIIFYFILKYFDTANLIPSTISVTSSFFAAYLTARRSPYFALAYAVNDVILIILWTLASISDISYLSVTMCFIMFLANDIYGFISWQKMQKRQESNL